MYLGRLVNYLALTLTRHGHSKRRETTEVLASRSIAAFGPRGIVVWLIGMEQECGHVRPAMDGRVRERA